MKNFKVFSLFASLFLIFGMATTGCSQTNPDSATSNDSSISNSNDDTSTSSHEHTFSRSYEYDDTYHWHPSTCGHNVVSEKEKHTFKEEVTDPTYEQGGYITYTCSICGYSYVDDETNKLEHNYSFTWSYDEYSHWHACTDKGYEHLKKDESNHTFTTSITDPTYEQGGYTTYTCSICGYSYIDNKTNALPITITWKNYEGSILEVDNNVPYGSMPTFDGATPIKESDNLYKYYFAGWTPEVEPASEDTTYTAVFTSEEITYTVDFDLNGGISSSYKGPIEVTTFSKDIFFFDCVKEDWQFRGWKYNGEKIFDEKGNQLKNVTLVDNMLFKAIYSQTVKLAIITNMPEAGTITGEGEYPYNTYVDVSVKPNQGYKFVGWYYQNTLLSNEEVYKYMMWDQDITLEARFELDYFKMRVYSNSEEHGLVLLRSNSNFDYLPEYQEQRKYTSDVTIAAYSKTDVRFLGWYDENNELITTNAVYTFIMPNHDYTLEAKWNHFTINYNLNGGTNNLNNRTSYSIEDDNISLLPATKEGFEFLGWQLNGEFVDTIDTSKMQNITLDAIFSDYGVKIIENEGVKSAQIIGGNKNLSEIVIPQTIEYNGETLFVTSIADNAFSNCSILTSVLIPDTIKSIGNYAFDNCTYLSSLNIPHSVNTIGQYAFRNCTSLEKVNIGEDSKLTSIGDHAFDNCSSLISIYIPISVTIIQEYAFRSCSNLTIYCEASSKLVGYDINWNATNCPVIWDSYKGYFDNFNGLNYIICNADGGSNPYAIITAYDSSKENVNIPSIVEINGETFEVREISPHCFENTNIISISIPSSVTTIGEYAFARCPLLTSIYIPKSVTNIDNYAFFWKTESSPNENLLHIYCERSSKASGWDSYWNVYRATNASSSGGGPWIYHNYVYFSVSWGVSYEEYLEAIV